MWTTSPSGIENDSVRQPCIRAASSSEVSQPNRSGSGKTSAKQARRLRWPVLTEPATTEALERRIASAALALVLHEAASVALAGADDHLVWPAGKDHQRFASSGIKGPLLLRARSALDRQHRRERKGSRN